MYTKLMEEMKVAMKAKDTKRLTVIRSIISDVKLLAKEAKIEPTEVGDETIATIVMKKEKEVTDTIKDAKKGNRQDIIDEAEAELAILKDFELQKLSEDEIRAIIKEVQDAASPTEAKNMGYMMKNVKEKTVGRADNKLVSDLVKEAIK